MIMLRVISEMRLNRLVLCSFLLSATRLLSQHPETPQGKSLFVRKCSACHGDTAKGGRGPDLTSGSGSTVLQTLDLMRNIIKGIPGTQMPAITMSESDARLIIGFLRSAASSATVVTLPGDPDVGRRLFFESTGCVTCHMFGGRRRHYGAGAHAHKVTLFSRAAPCADVGALVSDRSDITVGQFGARRKEE